MNQQTTIPSTKQASGNIELVWKILQNIPTEKLFGIDLQATGLIDGDPREAGYDTSVFQGIVNHDIMKLYGYNFWYGRMGISWGYVDPTFAINWEKAGIAGLYRSSYHVIYTNQPIKSQFDNWIKHHPKIDKVPRIIDLEVDTGDTYTNKANAVKSMSDMVLNHDGVRPIIYSRKNIIDPWLASWSAELLNAHYYILAQYLYDRTVEHPGPPSLPNRMNVNRILWHQTADKKAGPPGAVQSASLDRDRWERDDVTVAQFFGGIVPTTSWYEDIDTWARSIGFKSSNPPPQ